MRACGTSFRKRSGRFKDPVRLLEPTSKPADVATIPMDPKKPNTYVLALRETALLLGGERKLAEFLGIDEWLVSRWLQGLGHPPELIYSRCTERIEFQKQAVAVTDGRDQGVPSRP